MKSGFDQCLDVDNLIHECHEELTCMICLQFMTHPHYADCGHVFGINCIKRWTKSDCPLCRKKVTSLNLHKEVLTSFEAAGKRFFSFDDKFDYYLRDIVGEFFCISRKDALYTK